jgi:hypothetical protein
VEIASEFLVIERADTKFGNLAVAVRFIVLFELLISHTFA